MCLVKSDGDSHYILERDIPTKGSCKRQVFINYWLQEDTLNTREKCQATGQNWVLAFCKPTTSLGSAFALRSRQIQSPNYYEGEYFAIPRLLNIPSICTWNPFWVYRHRL